MLLTHSAYLDATQKTTKSGMSDNKHGLEKSMPHELARFILDIPPVLRLTN